jgi:hypothetical protein
MMMTESKPNIALIATLLKLPAEAQLWIMCLTPDQFNEIQTVLNIVGENNFIKHWRTHKEDQEKLEDDFRRWPLL